MGHKFVYDKPQSFNIELGLKSALLACCRALKVPFSWKIYHAFLGTGGNTKWMLFFPFSKALNESFKSSADPGLKHVKNLKIGRHKYVCSKVIKIHFHIFL